MKNILVLLFLLFISSDIYSHAETKMGIGEEYSVKDFHEYL